MTSSDDYMGNWAKVLATQGGPEGQEVSVAMAT
jgi:hypothetical protein